FQTTVLGQGFWHLAVKGGRATIRPREKGAAPAAAKVQAELSFRLAFRQTGKRRKKSGVALISQKLTLFLNQCAVTAAIGGIKPIDFRLSDLLCAPLCRLPRRVVFPAFPRSFAVVACSVGRPRKCKSQCNDCNVAHQSIPPSVTTHHTQEPSARVRVVNCPQSVRVALRSRDEFVAVAPALHAAGRRRREMRHAHD